MDWDGLDCDQTEKCNVKKGGNYKGYSDSFGKVSGLNMILGKMFLPASDCII